MFWKFIFCFLMFEKYVYSNINFCHKGSRILAEYKSSTHNFTEGYHYCPAGLLFRSPQTVLAVHSDLNGFCVKSNICPDKSDRWKCGMKKQSIPVQLITHGSPMGKELWEFLENDGEIDGYTSECSESPKKYFSTSENDIRSRRQKRQTISLDETNHNITNEVIHTELLAQTKRMFYFLAGINVESISSNLRSVSLLLKSAEIIRGSCDPMFLSSKFIDATVRAFLFLLKEQGTERVEDIDTDSYDLLMKSLTSCNSGEAYLVSLKGSRCPLALSVDSIERKFADGNLKSVNYKPNKNSFRWGKYDVVIDAVWNIVDFVHGMCFSTFLGNINLHHRFQMAMEELFRHTIQTRWSYFAKLRGDYQYDNMLLASVNDSMSILDACVQGSYIGSPFQHRLGRPIEEENLSAHRKRRSANLAKPTEATLDAYCLQTEEERNNRITELRRLQCF